MNSDNGKVEANMTEAATRQDNDKAIVGSITTQEQEAFVDPSIIEDVDAGLTPEQRKLLRSRQAWLEKIRLESEPGRAVMPDPYRSPTLDMLGTGSVMDDIQNILIEQTYEKLLQESTEDANAVAVARIANMRNIAQLSNSYSSVVNAILGIAEALDISREVVSYTDDLRCHRYIKAVTVGDQVGVNDLRHIAALIVAKSKTALDVKDNLEKALKTTQSMCDAKDATLAQMREDISKMRSEPKPTPLSKFSYVLSGIFTVSKQGAYHQEVRYAYEAEDGIYKLTGMLTKAKKFTTEDKAVKKLYTLLSKPSDNLIDNPELLSVNRLHMLPVALKESNAQMLAPYKKV